MRHFMKRYLVFLFQLCWLEYGPSGLYQAFQSLAPKRNRHFYPFRAH